MVSLWHLLIDAVQHTKEQTVPKFRGLGGYNPGYK